MNWIEDVKKRLKNGNQILFTKDSQYLQDLMLLFEGRDRRILVLWALDLAGESAGKLEEKYPGERRPAEAVTAVRDWSRGKIKMRQAQRKIPDCHAFAKEDDFLPHFSAFSCATHGFSFRQRFQAKYESFFLKPLDKFSYRNYDITVLYSGVI